MRSVLDGQKYRGHSPAGRVKALDELLDFPHLNILFRLILTHFSTDTRPLWSESRRGCPWAAENPDERFGSEPAKLPPGQASFFFSPARITWRSDHQIVSWKTNNGTVLVSIVQLPNGSKGETEVTGSHTHSRRA